jgi:hypothetical protein
LGVVDVENLEGIVHFQSVREVGTTQVADGIGVEVELSRKEEGVGERERGKRREEVRK